MTDKNIPNKNTQAKSETPVVEVNKNGEKLTHETFNGTSGAAVSKHTSSGDASKEADRLNAYHNVDHFSARSTKAGQELVNKTGDPTVAVATGDGTQSNTFNPDASKTEVAKDKSDISLQGENADKK